MDALVVNLPEQDDKIGTELPNPDREMFDKLKEQYGFSTDAEAARIFLKLGMMSTVNNDPRHSISSETGGEFSPVTIRELVPEGMDNAVEITDEFWDQILRDEMIDIVENDPEIHRDGLEIYR
ncbi:hypothetical protein [Halorussus marinus]|jgi:hypothetical protein|uniref:hypothetical protein n=1 Tax=Halorussus marinus TaxID=2505976 RepID=UPI001092421B|nr:hypothetical protein [Halorussus marinus]